MTKRKRRSRSAGLNFLGDFKPGKSTGSWLNKPTSGSIFGPPKRNNWLMSNPSGGLFGSPAPKRRARRKNGRNHERRESRSYERREHRNGNGAKIGAAIAKGASSLASRGYAKAKAFYEKDKAEMAEIRRKAAETKSAEKTKEEERARRYREGVIT